MPFALSIEGLIIARKLHVPHTAAFHVQPENITSSIGFKNALLINKAIYFSFRDIFYNHFTHIHCPSRFIAQELKKTAILRNCILFQMELNPIFATENVKKQLNIKTTF